VAISKGPQCRYNTAVSRLVAVLAMLAVLQGPPARAQTTDDVDLAKRRYETGRWLYEHQRYDEALTEFRAAKMVSKRPQLDYNIGLCEEQLGHLNEAAEAYRRFVHARPDDFETDELRSRIARLDALILAARPPPPPYRAHRSLALGLGVTGLVLGATGIALGSVVLARRHDDALYDQNHAMAVTTDVLLPVGGTLALAGLVVWLVDRKHQRAR
jgi:tetratricopeptide (TPR) repeat protein